MGTRPRTITWRLHAAIGHLLLGAALSATPTCAGQQVLARARVPQLVEYATSKKSFETTPQTAESYFGKLASLTSTRRGEFWRFTGRDAATGILWVDLGFRESQRPGEWALLEADVALTPRTAEEGGTFQAVCDEIGKRLRRPKFACRDNAEKRVGWTVAPRWVGSLHEGDFEDPISHTRTHATMLTLSILEGEDE